MIRTLTMLLLLSMAAQGLSQTEITAPPVVSSAFQHKYPGATDVSLEYERGEGYEYSFDFHGKKMDAVFAKNGEWIKTEWPGNINDLGPEVINSLKKRFAKFDIIEIDHLTSPGIEEAFELELATYPDVVELVISRDGRILEMEIEAPDNEDDGEEDH